MVHLAVQLLLFQYRYLYQGCLSAQKNTGCILNEMHPVMRKDTLEVSINGGLITSRRWMGMTICWNVIFFCECCGLEIFT